MDADDRADDGTGAGMSALTTLSELELPTRYWRDMVEWLSVRSMQHHQPRRPLMQ